jgi:hypothetical protein
MEMSDHLYTPAALTLRIKLQANILQEAGWVPEPVSTRWRRKYIHSSVENQTRQTYENGRKNFSKKEEEDDPGLHPNATVCEDNSTAHSAKHSPTHVKINFKYCIIF